MRCLHAYYCYFVLENTQMNRIRKPYTKREKSRKNVFDHFINLKNIRILFFTRDMYTYIYWFFFINMN